MPEIEILVLKSQATILSNQMLILAKMYNSPITNEVIVEMLKSSNIILQEIEVLINKK